MKVYAKCHNYAGCLLAYRGEEIELPADAPLVCPECGKPLTVVKPGPSKIWRFVPLLVLAALVILVVVFGRPVISSLFSKKDAQPSGVAQTETGNQNTAGSTSTPTAEGKSEPPATVTAPQQIDLNLAKAENQQVKAEVLKRIDLMPNVSSSNKDKLYNSVERARSMGKVLTIPFGSGKITLGAAEAMALKEEFEKPEIMKLRDEPTAVFVVLGYADPKGDEKKNLAISQTRADAVVEAMTNKVGVKNVVHSVAMGGSTVVDAKDLEKNRIVEVWAVLP
jgi:outer membrane protein OmpA-like peptidoglycan-associated protein